MINSIQTNRQEYQNYSLYQTHTDSQVNEMVQAIIENQKQLHCLNKENALKESKNDELTWFFLEEPNWKEKEKHYLIIEKWLNRSPQIPLHKPSGPIHYAMSLEEMEDAITHKFQHMASAGQVKKQSDLQGQEKNYYSHSSADLMTGCTNLTRIWGAQFLEEELKEDEGTLRVAEHFLIIENGAEHLEITLLQNNYFPSAWKIDNGYVISQRITGKPSAKEYRENEALKKTGFYDFSDPGNILKDSHGIGWIVDTEHKSFCNPSNTVEGLTFKITDYLQKRFKWLNQTKQLIKFSIPVASIFK